MSLYWTVSTMVAIGFGTYFDLVLGKIEIDSKKHKITRQYLAKQRFAKKLQLFQKMNMKMNLKMKIFVSFDFWKSRNEFETREFLLF